MAYQYLPGDLLGKGPMVDKDYNAVTFKPWSAEPRKQACAGWRTTAPHETYQGRYVEVLKSLPQDPKNPIDPFLRYLFLPSQQTYYRFSTEKWPGQLEPGVSFVGMCVDKDESHKSIKNKLTKLLKSGSAIGIQPRSVCPLLHKLSQPGGDPEGLLPLLDRVVTVSERNLNTPSAGGCTIS